MIGTGTVARVDELSTSADAPVPRPVVRIPIGDPARLAALKGPQHLRLQLHHKGVPVGKVDLDRPITPQTRRWDAP